MPKCAVTALTGLQWRISGLAVPVPAFCPVGEGIQGRDDVWSRPDSGAAYFTGGCQHTGVLQPFHCAEGRGQGCSCVFCDHLILLRRLNRDFLIMLENENIGT